jgi:hypothetical protein
LISPVIIMTSGLVGSVIEMCLLTIPFAVSAGKGGSRLSRGPLEISYEVRRTSVPTLMSVMLLTNILCHLMSLTKSSNTAAAPYPVGHLFLCGNDGAHLLTPFFHPLSSSHEKVELSGFPPLPHVQITRRQYENCFCQHLSQKCSFGGLSMVQSAG